MRGKEGGRRYIASLSPKELEGREQQAGEAW